MRLEIWADVTLIKFRCEVVVLFNLIVATDLAEYIGSALYYYLSKVLLGSLPSPTVIINQLRPSIELGARAIVPYADVGRRRAAQTLPRWYASSRPFNAVCGVVL